MAVATEQLTGDALRPEHPLRDAALEDAFARHGVTRWDFDPALEVAAIDKERSLANQARLEPLNVSVVERYAEDMAGGDEFPAIVVERQRAARGQRLVVIGGNHRAAAARIAKRDHLAAYVVEADAGVLYRLMWEDNRRHGFPPSDAERLMAAVHLVDQGDTMAAAARTVGVAYPKLMTYVAAREFDRRANKSGQLGAAMKLAIASKQRLATLAIEVFEPAVAAVLRHGLASNDVNDLVALLNGATTPEAGLALLGERDAELALAGLSASGAERRRGHQSPRATMLSALGTIRHSSAARVVADCADDDQRKVLANAIRDAASILQQVLREVS